MDSFDDDLLDIEGLPPPPVEKVFDFYVTTPGGMEEVALGELKSVLKQISRVRIERGRRVGHIFFRYERSPRKLLDLRSVENVFALLADIRGVTVGQPGLLRIAQRVGQVDLLPAAVLHDLLWGPKEQAAFRLSCVAGKGHRFSASELHQMLQAVLTMKYDVDETHSPTPYPLHLRVQGNRALFGLQLSHRHLRERTYRRVEVAGELAPPAAFCLAQLGRLRAQDRVLDMRCGGGTLLIEIGLSSRVGRLVGVDIFDGVLRAACENASVANVRAAFLAGKTDGLPFVRASFDKAFGNLVTPRGAPPMAIGPILRETARVLRPGGQAILVVEDRKEAQDALDQLPVLKTVKRLPLHVQGRHPDIYILQRR